MDLHRAEERPRRSMNKQPRYIVLTLRFPEGIREWEFLVLGCQIRALGVHENSDPGLRLSGW